MSMRAQDFARDFSITHERVRGAGAGAGAGAAVGLAGGRSCIVAPVGRTPAPCPGWGGGVDAQTVGVQYRPAVPLGSHCR